MTKPILFATLALGASFLVPATAMAQSACTSTWQKAHSQIDKFIEPVGALVCYALDTQDREQAQKCLEQVKKWAAKAQEIKQYWNLGINSWTIGPRALPLDRPQSGAVATERQFVGQPNLNDEYTLSIERTGGKAKHDLIIDICFYDPVTGNDVEHDRVRLSRDGKQSFARTYEGTDGTFALIHLDNEKWGTNSHQYTLRASASGVPDNVAQAQKTVSGGTTRPIR